MSTFLCGHCQACMCDDCKSIAQEYADLFARQKAYMHKANQELEAVRRELELAKRSRDDYKRVLELGVAPQMLAWMDSLTPAKLRAVVEKAKP